MIELVASLGFLLLLGAAPWLVHGCVFDFGVVTSMDIADGEIKE